MINDDILIKYTIREIESGEGIFPDWVNYVKYLKDQILYIVLGFPGIGNNDLELHNTRYRPIQVGDRVILDKNLNRNCGRDDTDSAAILGVIQDPETLIVEGIGQGFDSEDPQRLIRVGYPVRLNLVGDQTYLRVISVPRPDGGPIYHYYHRNFRDARW